MAKSTPIERAGLAIAGLGLALVVLGYASIRVPRAERFEFVYSQDPAVIELHKKRQVQCMGYLLGQQTPAWCADLPVAAGEHRMRPRLFVIRDTIGNYGDPLFNRGYQTPDLLVWWGARIIVLGLFVWWFYEATLAKLFRWIRHGKADPSN